MSEKACICFVALVSSCKKKSKELGTVSKIFTDVQTTHRQTAQVDYQVPRLVYLEAEISQTIHTGFSCSAVILLLENVGLQTL